MRHLNTALRLHNPPAASPSQAYAASDLVGRIANALDDDGTWIADGTLDSGGMTIIAGEGRYRVEVSYEGPCDPNALQEQIDRDRMREEDRRDAEHDRDWMADQGDDMPF
jgi:hypothetical protein